MLNLWAIIRAFSRDLVPQADRLDREASGRASRLVAFTLAMMLWVPVFSIIHTLLGAPISSNVILSGGVMLLGILLLLRRGVSPEVCGNLLTAAAWYVYTALAMLNGGIAAPAMAWYATVPILSVLLSGNRAGACWTAATAATVSGFALLRDAGWPPLVEVTPAAFDVLRFTGLVGMLLCVYLLVSMLKKMEFEARGALHEANCQLERQATTDALTGIPNRHRFEQMLEQEWSRHERAGLPLSIALVDADYFKAFNDEYGHLAGDECLRMVACAIQSSIRRPGDFCARFGGEEFVIIQPNTDSDGALRVAELIRAHVRTLGIPHGNSAVSDNVTISIGISTTIPTRDRSHLDFLNDVDMALYRAKAEGRDRIVQVTSGAVEAAL